MKPPDYIDESALNIFVDGASLPAPRRGGLGIRYVWVDEEGNPQSDEEPFPYSHQGASNNQMELEAPIQALKTATGRRGPISLHAVERLIIWSDSRYFVDHLHLARFVWPTIGWTKKEGAPVDNVRQWKELRKLCERIYRDHRRRVDAHWIPGKKGEHAKDVDKKAKKAANSPLKRKLDHQQVRKKWSPLEVNPGCEQIRGQQEVVRIVGDKEVGHNRIYKYRYEVVNEASSDHQLVDFAYTTLMLKAGHVYCVTFNDEQGNPRIVEAVELPKGRRYWDAQAARRAAVVDHLRVLGVTGVLLKAAEQGRVTEVACQMPKCLCPEEAGGRRYFERKAHPPIDWMPTPDHYPLLKKDGGKLTVDNVRLAHRSCNRVDYALQVGRTHQKDLDRAAAFRQEFIGSRKPT
jgi:ribonuclease HI